MSLLTFCMLAAVLSCGFYFMLGRHFSSLIVGVAVVSNGINLLLIETSHPVVDGVDPLPQALILTAIVIGFALLAFLASFALEQVRGRSTDEVPPVEGGIES